MVRTIYLLAAVLMLSCSREFLCVDSYNTELSLLLTDRNGENLLSPEHPDKIDVSKIKLYSINPKGEQLPYDSPMINLPKIKVSQSSDKHLLTLPINTCATCYEYRKSLIDFGEYGISDIKIRRKLILPVSAPMRDIGTQDELYVNGKKIDKIDEPIPIRLSHIQK